jgi:hypothetical protein
MSIEDVYNIFEKTARPRKAEIVRKISVYSEVGGSFHDGLKQGLESAINLLKDAEDMSSVKEILSYLEEIHGGIKPGIAYDNAPLSAAELKKLMSFDIL